jgi:hypothetical protein
MTALYKKTRIKQSCHGAFAVSVVVGAKQCNYITKNMISTANINMLQAVDAL